MTFRFGVALTTAILFGLIGYLLALVIPLPPPYSLSQSKMLYVLLGVLTAIGIFARLTQWILRTSADLTRQLIVRISTEVSHQMLNLHLRDRDTQEKVVNPIILDTSGLIDGRVLEVAKTGFVSGIVLLPDFVLRELQQVADSADPIKRARGRRGFEVVEELKKIDGVKLQVWDEGIRNRLGNIKNVDDKLVKLGRAYKGRILTVDYNLNRVASASGVKVLNLNELGNALKTLPVPGESIELKIVHLGKDQKQGVGYLSDGTMIVVKEAAEDLGKTVKVEVNKILQGSAGRMVFGQRISH